jgi:hypothetical protein
VFSVFLFKDELLRTLASLGEEVRSCTSRFDEIKTRLCQVPEVLFSKRSFSTKEKGRR